MTEFAEFPESSVRARSRPRSRLLPAAFGARPSGERLARVLRSPQYRDGAFRNGGPVRLGGSGDLPALLRDLLLHPDRGRRKPAGPVPLVRPAAADPSDRPGSGLRLTWLGHAGVLAEIDGHRVLFDPVWGERCSPFPFAGPRRLHRSPLSLRELGRLDAVVISHDHYDHLDMPTIRSLARGGAAFVMPLGVGAHLEHWGVPARRLTELDWGESTRVGELTLTATPGQHFCGRGLRDRFQTLWASWVVAGPRHRVFHSGDTGYFPGFAAIGREHGPFDATMMQVGAYSTEHWPDIHMTPEEGVRAHLDLSGGSAHGVLLPVHWGTFVLAMHPWEEPAERTVREAGRLGVTVAVPRPGESFEPAAGLPLTAWWEAVAARPAPAATASPLGARPARPAGR
ncbi:MBL fold metallo-hydrolase [Streptomyces sp. DSM 44917]|uniref:MBL fold metallo-hydrolase n=1 Tax=Streptomyces boetiae TaxID=3075541 RepID=A0ABU2L4U5_9ACTN|nr:MBL fold metallo-hydrolase [Streptomyces sp. DSM 44917]MDT0306579.1 MBL fold metallo-hydrolase [Streptomyces sp. DSM 44917]